MRMDDLDRPEYGGIEIIMMADNDNGGLPVHIRTYDDVGYTSYLHRHEMIQINYINRGTVISEINGAGHELVRGDIFVMPPYVPHRLTPVVGSHFEIVELEFMPEFVYQNIAVIDDMESYSSFIDFSYIEPFLVSERNIKPRLNLSGEAQRDIEGLMRDFRREYEEREDGYLLAIRAIVLMILVKLGRYFRDSGDTRIYVRHREAVERAIEYMSEHYDKPLQINDMARMAMFSPSYFSYLFKATTGRTFVEYLNDVRVRAASLRLKQTDDRVSDISQDTGFNNITHFNRIFKGITGVTPTQYRSASRRE